MKKTTKNTMNSGVSKALRNIVAERDSYTCVLCENGYTDIHHVTPRSQGGRTNPYNLVCLCRQCHMMIHRELPLSQYWKNIGYNSIGEWVDICEQRLVEYTADYYAEDLEFQRFYPDGKPYPLEEPIDHDRFTIYGGVHSSRID